MEPTPNFGSGGALLGDTTALKQAMAEKGIPTSVLDQVGSNSPTAKPDMAPSQLVSPVAPAAGGAGPVPQPAATAPNPTALPAGNPEAQVIVKALGARLAGLTKMGQ